MAPQARVGHPRSAESERIVHIVKRDGRVHMPRLIAEAGGVISPERATEYYNRRRASSNRYRGTTHTPTDITDRSVRVGRLQLIHRRVNELVASGTLIKQRVDTPYGHQIFIHDPNARD